MIPQIVPRHAVAPVDEQGRSLWIANCRYLIGQRPENLKKAPNYNMKRTNHEFEGLTDRRGSCVSRTCHVGKA